MLLGALCNLDHLSTPKHASQTYLKTRRANLDTLAAMPVKLRESFNFVCNIAYYLEYRRLLLRLLAIQQIYDED